MPGRTAACASYALKTPPYIPPRRCTRASCAVRGAEPKWRSRSSAPACWSPWPWTSSSCAAPASCSASCRVRGLAHVVFAVPFKIFCGAHTVFSQQPTAWHAACLARNSAFVMCKHGFSRLLGTLVAAWRVRLRCHTSRTVQGIVTRKPFTVQHHATQSNNHTAAPRCSRRHV